MLGVRAVIELRASEAAAHADGGMVRGGAVVGVASGAGGGGGDFAAEGGLGLIGVGIY